VFVWISYSRPGRVVKVCHPALFLSGPGGQIWDAGVSGFIGFDVDPSWAVLAPDASPGCCAGLRMSWFV